MSEFEGLAPLEDPRRTMQSSMCILVGNNRQLVWQVRADGWSQVAVHTLDRDEVYILATLDPALGSVLGPDAALAAYQMVEDDRDRMDLLVDLHTRDDR